MKNWRTLLFFITTIIMNASFAEIRVVDKIAAIVNSSVILESDVNKLMRLVKEFGLDESGQHFTNDITMRHQILERLILDEIVLQIGQKMGIKVTDKQLDQIIANIAKKNNITIAQMSGRLARNGIDYDNYRNQLRKSMVIYEVYNNEVRHRVIILPQEVDALFQQIRKQKDNDVELNLSHILIQLPINPTSDQIIAAKNQANSIVNRARNNGDFHRLATIYSTNKQAINEGNKTDWVRIKELPPAFAQALINAKKGDIIGPIRLEVGFYVLKVNDIHIKNRSTPVTEVRTRHILMKQSLNMNDDQLRTRLQQIADDIRSGKISFSNAAKKFSQDSNSSSQGGDLGWASTDTYDQALLDVLVKLNKGQMSDPVRSSSGWHLIELTDTRNVVKDNTEQRDRAYRMLFDRKFSEEATAWIQEQRAKAYVKVLSK